MIAALILLGLLLTLAHSTDKRRQAERKVAELDAQLTASEVERARAAVADPSSFKRIPGGAA